MQQSKPKSAHAKSNSSGVVRIIGGSMRGRKIRFQGSHGLRPTLDRVRETLFNWLARDIAQSKCLDLFAGSGAISFEALSRYAAHVTMVEKNKKVTEILKKNCQALNISNAKIYNLDANKFLASNRERFDIVFLDPPFGQKLLQNIFEALIPHLNQDALIYIEQEKSDLIFCPPEQFSCLKEKSSGNFHYALYQLS